MLLGIQGDAYANSKDDAEIIKQVIQNPHHAFIELKKKVGNEKLTNKRQAELRVLLAEISYYIDQPENVFKYTEQSLASGLLSSDWQVRALIMQARGYIQRRQYEKYFAVANKAVNSAEQHGLSKLKISALVERAYASTLLGYKIKAKADLSLANKYISFLSSTFEKGILLERFSIATSEIGNVKLAIKTQQQAIEIYKNISVGPHFLSIAYYNLGINYAQTRAWQKEGPAILKSYQWALKDNNYLNQAFTLTRLGKLEIKRTNIGLAEEYFISAKVAADKSESGRIKIIASSELAQFYCANDKEKACEALLVSTIAFAKTYHMASEVTSLTRTLAELYYQQKDFERAYQVLKTTIIKVEE